MKMKAKMKEKTVKFENKKIDSPNYSKDFNYCGFAQYVLNTVPLDGITLIQMSERLVVLQVFKDAMLKDTVEITLKQLSKVINAFEKIDKWSIVDENIILFHTYIKTLKDE